MITKEELSAAVSATIAEKILAGLDESYRAEFLKQAIMSSLKDYSVKSAVEKAVADKAMAVAKELLANGTYGEEIVAAVKRGLARYIERLPDAVVVAMEEMMHGKEGSHSYDRMPGIIIKHLRKGRENAES